MTTSPVHRQPPVAALLLSMVASMGDHQGHSALPTAGARCECFRWMRVGDGHCPNSFRATGDNSTAYAGSFGDYNTATASDSDDGGNSLGRMCCSKSPTAMRWGWRWRAHTPSGRQ